MSFTKIEASGLNLNDIAPLYGTRNRIINGDMRIDQRLSGSSITISNSTNTYFVDRWRANANGGGQFSVQRSTVAPPGFTNSILATVTTADSSVVSGDFYHIRQSIEGFNFSDIQFGSVSAKPITVSFYVRSSVTGTYTFLLRNEAGNRGYLTTYSISAANTWEYKTITIPGDTSGTWTTDNTGCAIVNFNLGHGNPATINTWTTSPFEGATGQTQWISNAGATFYLTGVQLEVGTVATPFERRPFGTELNLCYRYFQQLGNVVYATIGSGVQISTTQSGINVPLLQPVRTNPTISVNSLIVTDRATADAPVSSINESRVSETSVYVSLAHAAFGAFGRGCLLAVAGTGYLRVSAEL